MVLTTHAVAGAALAQTMPDNLALGFGLAFVSHFILDMIPHWDYPLSALEKSADGKKINQRFKLSPALVADFMKTGADASLGLILTFVFFYPLNQAAALALVAGVVGALLPDFLQFIFYRYRPFWLKPLQRFHLWIHATSDLNNRPVLGIICQLVVIAIFILVLN